MPSLSPTARTAIHRMPQRASYDHAVIYGILDEGLFCHVGFTVDDHPYVIPTIHARVGAQLYIHGSAASRMLQSLSEGALVCVTVTLLDGLVLARSAYHHSMNYRSVIILGTAVEVTHPAERLAALKALVEHVVPGRWDDVRRPNEHELKATKILRVPIDEASAKVRTGPPIDDDEDYALSFWAGEIPMRLTPYAPTPDPRLGPDTVVPDYVRNYTRLGSSNRKE